MKHIEALIAEGGEITIGAIGAVDGAATAADQHNALAILVRRDGETLNALLRRLDRAVATKARLNVVVQALTSLVEPGA